MTKSYAGAVAAGILTADQARSLEAFMAASETTAPVVSPAAVITGPRFDLAHVLWYFGALIIIGAMGLFSTLAFSQMGARALLVTALAYAAAFIAAGHHLWHGRGLTTPGGLLIAAAVSMTPLAVFSIQDLLGWWAGLGKPGSYKDFYIWIKGGFLPMEIATIVAAVVALRFYRFPFILAIAAVVIWFMSMDVADWLRGSAQGSDWWDLRRKISLAFGLILIPIAWGVDLRRKDVDFAFWLHLVGIVTFWGGLTFQESNNEFAKFLYFLINLGLIGLSVFLSRRVYAVFGGIGAMIYFGNLAGKVFKDSLLFPFALSAIGLGVIGLGLLYYRRSAEIEQKLQSMLPEFLLKLRPTVRG